MTHYEQLRVDGERIRLQTEAEFAFAKALEAQGIDCDKFMKQLRINLHEFNVIAHFVKGVNDEEPRISPAVRAMLVAVGALHSSPERNHSLIALA